MKSVKEAEACLDTFCLVAKWGDMSARGIGDSAHVVLFGREYDDLVRRFLVAQVKRETNSTFKFKSSLMKTSTEYERQESEELAGEYWGLFSKMRTV